MEKTYQQVHYLFYAILALIVAGFYKTYFGLFPHFEGLKSIYHFHALTLLAWVAILIIQPFLIRKNKVEWHQRIGKLSYLLVPLMIYGIFLVATAEQNRAKNLMNFSFVLSDVSFFLLMYLLAIINRKNTPNHIRYMIMTVLPFINPAIGRLNQGFPSALIGLSIIIAMLVIEYYNKKQYKAISIGLVAYLYIYLTFMSLNESHLDTLWHCFF